MFPIVLSHLPPLSYMDRCALLTISLLYLVVRIAQNKQGIAVLCPINTKTRQPNIQGIVAVLNLISLIVYDVYNAINVKVKYTEGYLVTEYMTQKDVVHAVPLPAGMWNGYDQFTLLPVCNELLNVAFALKSSAHFLGLAYWHVTVKKHLGVSFGRTWEFVAYEAYSFLSLALYPIAQSAAPTVSLSIVYPQLIYHVEGIIIVALTVSIVVRMRNLMKLLSLPPSAVRRMQFYITLNILQAVFVAMDFVGLGAINIDTITRGAFTKNAFWTDIFTEVFNIGYAFATIVITTMVFPIFANEAESAGNVRMLEKFILTPEGRAKFKEFCDKEMASENVNFFLAAVSFKNDYAKRSPDENLCLARQIYHEYLAPGAPQEVNLSSNFVRAFRSNQFIDGALLHENTFAIAQQEIFKLMDADTFARFKVENPAMWRQFAEKVEQEQRLRGALQSEGVGDQSRLMQYGSVQVHVGETKMPLDSRSNK
ncbi:RGS domain-containing protein [Plasmodiophora brassicae]